MREWRRPSGDREDVYAMSRKPPTGDFDDAGLEVSEPKTWAAGMPGVTAALRHSYEQMGVRRTALTSRCCVSGSTARGWVSATMHPPNPPPVMREP